MARSANSPARSPTAHGSPACYLTMPANAVATFLQPSAFK